MKNLEKNLSSVFNNVAWLEGISVLDKKGRIMSNPEISFSGKGCDNFLLLSTLSRMLKCGDIKIEIISDVSGKKEYLLKLLNGVENGEY